MKKSLLMLLAGSLIFGGVTTSCGFFGSEAYSISDVTSKLNEDGTTTITITFTDEANMPPYSFTIPKGNGIKDIQAVHDVENEIVKITISFTDPTVKDYVITVPVINGNGIKEIIEEVDEATGDKFMVIKFSDGRPDLRLLIPKGDQGVGIKSLTPTYNDDKTILLTIEFDDGTKTEVTIPAPKDGVSVSTINVEVDPVTGKNKITFMLSDGSSQDIFIDRATVWYSGEDDPTLVPDFGFIGDFYFETVHYIIYKKTEIGWEVIANLGSAVISKKYEVKFNLNDTLDGGVHANFVEGGKSTYQIPEGRTFSSIGLTVPLASRTGYDFKGWYTSTQLNPTLGAFTDMTPVYSSLNLWAIWEKIA